MSAPFTKSLGELRVERTLASDPTLPCVEAVHPDGRVLHAKALAITAGIGSPALAAFNATASAAHQLAHPAIATPRLWSSSAPPFVAVDAIDGEPLGSLAEAGPLSTELVIAIGVDLAEALEVAHAAGVVHGGVGLGAVTLGREGRAILGDFAIAALASALVNAHSQLLGSVAATLAPEQLNDTPTSAATDVFALGSLLYRLLAGAYPFDAPSPMGMTLKLSMGSFEPLEAKSPATPPALAALVHRMLAQAPASRPSARDVVIALLELAPREDARRERIRAMLPRTPEPIPPESSAPAAPPSQPTPAAPSPTPPRAESAEPPLEWVDAMGFEDAPATEYMPELARSIEADAGIASSLVITPPCEPRTTAPPGRVSTPYSRTEAPPPIALYALIALFAIVILIGAVVTAVALAG